MEPNKKNNWNVYAIVSGFVFETIAVIALGFLAGYYLDEWLNTDFLFTVLLMLLAVFYAIYHLIKVVNRAGDSDESK
jgi:F0F1-type ATP synthase assembly protein I